MNVIAACEPLGLMPLFFAGETGLASAKTRGAVQAATGTPAA